MGFLFKEKLLRNNNKKVNKKHKSNFWRTSISISQIPANFSNTLYKNESLLNELFVTLAAQESCGKSGTRFVFKTAPLIARFSYIFS